MLKNGKIWSKTHKRFIGCIDKWGYLKVTPPKGYKHKGLHQYIWMVANQAEIPEGYNIHHIDENKLNNNINNLELIERSKHLREHRLGVVMSEITKDKLRLVKKVQNFGENNPFYGKHHTEETKRKISEAKKGRIPWNKGIKMKKG